MSSKALRGAVVTGGLVVALLTATACGDASTASAPIVDHEVSTTALHDSEAPETSAQPVSEPSESESEEPEQDETPEAEAPEPDLPATAPDTPEAVSDDFVGPDGQPVTGKARRYLEALKNDNVTFMGDTDNNVALTTGEYICMQDDKGVDQITTKAFVTAMVGPGTDSTEAAGAKADKVIRAARAHYC